MFIGSRQCVKTQYLWFLWSNRLVTGSIKQLIWCSSIYESALSLSWLPGDAKPACCSGNSNFPKSEASLTYFLKFKVSIVLKFKVVLKLLSVNSNLLEDMKSYSGLQDTLRPAKTILLCWLMTHPRGTSTRHVHTKGGWPRGRIRPIQRHVVQHTYVHI